jgi:hypothetical protein
MRRRIVVLLVGVLLLVIIGARVRRSVVPDDMPLQVGMSEDEVDKRLGPFLWILCESSNSMGQGCAVVYCGKPDWFGCYRVTTVHFDGDNRVIRWDDEVRSLSWRDRWDRIARSVGW